MSTFVLNVIHIVKICPLKTFSRIQNSKLLNRSFQTIKYVVIIEEESQYTYNFDFTFADESV